MATSIDFETRSTVEIKEAGAHRYAADPSTSVWCMAYRVDGGPVELWTPGEPVPRHLTRPFLAWNAQFERLVWRHVLVPHYGFEPAPIEDWSCTMARAAAAGLPQSLEMAATVLKVGEKDMEGRRLMLQMSKPRSVSPSGVPIWWTDEDRMQRLFAYCRQDVVVESAIAAILPPLSDYEMEVWRADQRTNDRGVLTDRPLIEGALRIVEEETAEVNDRLAVLTGGVVNAVTNHGDILRYFQIRGVETNTVNKSYLADVVAQGALPEDVLEVAALRLEAGKTSTAKLLKLVSYADTDLRVRGMLRYHGAGPGRWSGAGPQPQNLPRGDEDMGAAEKKRGDEMQEHLVSLITKGDREMVRLVYGPPMVAVSSVLRGAFIAAPGHKLVAADYNAIEARGLAWVAEEQGLLETFWAGKSPYPRMASAIYGIPEDEIQKGTQQYQLGKAAVLGCGYQMGGPTFVGSAATYGVTLTEERAKEIVGIYRELHPRTKSLWGNLDRAAVEAVRSREPQHVGRLTFRMEGKYLWLILPSGRRIGYPGARLQWRETPWGVEREQVMVWGVDQTTRQWHPYYLYGGLITENAVQAIARDLLADAFLRLDQSGKRPVLTVHDEIVCEVPAGSMSATELEAIMCDTPAWAAGFPVAAEGWQGGRYHK